MVHAGVYRLPSVRPTWEADALAALLVVGPAGALSHGAAAWVWHLDGQARPDGAIDVTVPVVVRARGAPGVAVHRTRVPFKVAEVGPLRVTTVARTLVDLASTVSGRTASLEDALDSAQRLYPGTQARLRSALNTVGRGRRGTGLLRPLLAQRDGSATESWLEARVAGALRRAVLPRPKCQHEVYDAQGYVLRVDFAWPAEHVALHVDGYAYHQRRTRFERDREAVSRLTALGWQSLWVTHRALQAGTWLGSLRAVLEHRTGRRTE